MRPFTMIEPAARHDLFENARRRAGCSVRELWVSYLALGGTADAFSVEAYLCGLTSLSPGQQDVLANAVNERLQDLYLTAQVPYLHAPPLELPAVDPLSVLDRLFPPPSHEDGGRRSG